LFQGGQYILTLVDFYGANFTVFILGTIEMVGIGWIYGKFLHLSNNKFLISCWSYIFIGARGSVVAKALCYKPEGRWFDTRRGEFLNILNPSGRTRPCGLLSL
jgi:hypothetical protein